MDITFLKPSHSISLDSLSVFLFGWFWIVSALELLFVSVMHELHTFSFYFSHFSRVNVVHLLFNSVDYWYIHLDQNVIYECPSHTCSILSACIYYQWTIHTQKKMKNENRNWGSLRETFLFNQFFNVLVLFLKHIHHFGNLHGGCKDCAYEPFTNFICQF